MKRSKKLDKLIDAFAESMPAVPFGSLDTLIAAQDLGLTLVTDNTRHFRQIAGLKLDNWI